MSEWVYLELRWNDDGSWLTPNEIIDVEISWRQIKEGKAKKFEDVEEFLVELKGG